MDLKHLEAQQDRDPRPLPSSASGRLGRRRARYLTKWYLVDLVFAGLLTRRFEIGTMSLRASRLGRGRGGGITLRMDTPLAALFWSAVSSPALILFTYFASAATSGELRGRLNPRTE